MTEPIRTPDYRLRVFVSSTLGELADERRAVRDAVRRLRLAPVMFDAGARAHPPRELYRGYLAQSHIFLGIYWQRYGWVSPGEQVSGLEDEYRLSAEMPKLIYVKEPAPQREPRLAELLAGIEADDRASYRPFTTAEELGELVEDDLAVLLTERFEHSLSRHDDEVEVDTKTLDTKTVDTTARTAARAAPAPIVKPVTALIGRDDEVDEVLRLVDRDDVRLVTLCGPGGIGKSRIALAVASRVEERGVGDVTWVALAGTREARMVDSVIASALGLPETPSQPVLDSISAHLGTAAHLLVLDNFEHVLAAAPVVSELLRRCPGVTVLVASRSVLNVRGEHDITVPPLPVPSDADEVTDAVRLFEARARAVNPSFRISAANLPAVAAICRRLDGLPLAIELAAAQTRLLTPEALLSRLDSRLRALRGGARDLPERQQTLRAALDWDYDLLDAAERAFFRRLSAFAGGCTLDAAEAVVCAAGPVHADVFEGISSLINKSLLRLDVGASGQPRFTMLETIREYAQERLVAAGEAGPTHLAHATHFLELLRSTFLRGNDQVDQLGVLEDEHPNFRVALERAAEHGDVDLELRLVVELTPFWEVHGHLREGTARVEAALARSVGRRDPGRVRAALAAVIFARARLDHVHARALVDEALGIARELGDDRLIAWAMKDLGLLLQEGGRPEDAERCEREALARFERVGDESGAIRVLNNLAVSYLEVGRYDEAVDYLRRSYQRGRSLGDAVGATRSFQNIGLAKLLSGEPDIAERLLIRALARFLVLGSTWDVADCLDFVATAVAANGRLGSAATLVGASETLRARIGAPRPEHVIEGYRDAAVVLPTVMAAAELTSAMTAGSVLGPAALPGYLATIADPRLVDVSDRRVDEELLAQVVGVTAS